MWVREFLGQQCKTRIKHPDLMRNTKEENLSELCASVVK